MGDLVGTGVGSRDVEERNRDSVSSFELGNYFKRGENLPSSLPVICRLGVLILTPVCLDIIFLREEVSQIVHMDSNEKSDWFYGSQGCELAASIKPINHRFGEETLNSPSIE